MTEGAPKFENPLQSKEALKREKIALAKELFESRESFSFPGVGPDSYAELKAGDGEDPGYTTPTDKILERMQNEGMKIVLGKHPESGNIFVLPFQSDDIENDSISPRHLLVEGVEDEKLKRLIALSKS